MKGNIRIDDLPPSYQEVASAIGLDAAQRLVESFGGESIYIPKAVTVTRASRDRIIKDEFDGKNHRQLARRHGLTVTSIYQILQKQ